MADPTAPSRLRQESAFAASAHVYWLKIYPAVRRERERWLERARAIPEPVLRQDALCTIEEKWGHSEGAAAFAVLVPPGRRDAFVRMSIAFELMIDFLDTISEHAASDPWANSLRLHTAVRDALAPAPPRECDYYIFHSHRGDGGFLPALIVTCRDIFTTLPSCPAVANRAQELAALYGEAQAHCHAEEASAGSSAPTRRIDTIAVRHPELRWGTVVAGCASSLPVLALMAMATQEGCSAEEVADWWSAYFPWMGSLHILLHSLADESANAAAGSFNQLDHYPSKIEVAEGLGMIASRVKEQLGQLSQGSTHLALLGGMVGYYLAMPPTWQGESRLVAAAVLEAIGPTARWSMLVHRLRRGLGRMNWRRR